VYDPISGRWVTTSKMIEARTNHTATLLRDGRVLVAGGAGGMFGLPVDTAELFDPSTGRWTATGAMHETRANHTATLLPDGTVFVMGGAIDPDGVGVLATAEAYDPETGSWTSSGKAGHARAGHTATLLADGTVLVVGGVGEFVNPTASVALSAERYDPELSEWTGTLMDQARFRHTLTLLPDGKVLAAGGTPGFGRLLGSVELFDPGSGSWTNTGPMLEARSGHAAARLADGTVLLVGGEIDDATDGGTERYDPVDGSWAPSASMATPRRDHSATALLDGRVLVVGGSDRNGNTLNTAELYDPGS
jgi:Galactose oxidase, central domain